MILGHERQVDYLKKIAERKNPAHAYVFSGPRGLGKRAIAEAWAALFYCQKPSIKTLETCAKCFGCMLTASGANPDIVHLSLEHQLIDEPKKDIGIESIRELKRLASLTSYSGSWRFVIVDGADMLNESAQNAFLKLLEEPHERLVFVLITESDGPLLSTVRSRAVSLAFYPLTTGAMKKLLAGKKVTAPDEEIILTVAAGRPGVFTRLLADKKYFQDEKKEFVRIESLLSADVASRIFTAASFAADREGATEFFDRLIAVVYRKISTGSDALAYTKLMKKALDIRSATLHTNISPRLAAEVIALQVRAD